MKCRTWDIIHLQPNSVTKTLKNELGRTSILLLSFVFISCVSYIPLESNRGMGIGQTIKNILKEDTPQGENRGNLSSFNTDNQPTSSHTESKIPGSQQTQNFSSNIPSGGTTDTTPRMMETTPVTKSTLPPGVGPGTTGKPLAAGDNVGSNVPFSSTADPNRTYTEGISHAASHVPGTSQYTGPSTGATAASSIPSTGAGAGTGAAGTGSKASRVKDAFKGASPGRVRSANSSRTSSPVSIGRGHQRTSEPLSGTTGAAPGGTTTHHYYEATTPGAAAASGSLAKRNVLTELHTVGHTKATSQDAMPSGDTAEDSTQLNPVTHEHVRHVEIEEVEHRRELERHIHHIQHHTQPVAVREELTERFVERVQPVTHIQERHANLAEDSNLFQGQLHQHRDSVRRAETERTLIDKGTIVNEHTHHHIHHIIQPVVEKETIERTRVHTVIPSHEVTHEAPIIHQSQTHTAIPMEHFIGKGGALSGATSRQEIVNKVLHTGECTREVEGLTGEFSKGLHVEERGIDVTNRVPASEVTQFTRGGGVTQARVHHAEAPTSGSSSGAQGRYANTAGTGIARGLDAGAQRVTG